MTLAAQIAALQNLATAELCAEFERLHGRRPRYRSPVWLKKRIAHSLQVAAFGGLSAPARAELERLAGDMRLPAAAPTANTRGDDGRQQPRPGTVLQRAWHGKLIRVAVTAEGFVHEGELFASLSAVAKHVTGQHWSGPRFFNLKGASK